MRLGKIGQAQLGGQLGASTVGVVMALLGFHIWSLLVYYVARNVIKSLGFVWYTNDTPQLNFKYKKLRGLFAVGRRVFGVVSINNIMNRVDDIVVGGFVGNRALGMYNISWKFAKASNSTVMPALNRAILSKINDISGNKIALKNACHFTYKSHALIFMPVFALLSVMAPEIISVVYGPKWSDAVSIMQAMMIFGFLYSLYSISEHVYYALERQDEMFRTMLVSGGIYILSVVILTYVAGVKGTIVGVVISFLLLNHSLIKNLGKNETLGISLKAIVVPALLPTCAASVVTKAVVYSLSVHGDIIKLIAGVAAFGFTYLLILYYYQHELVCALYRISRGSFGSEDVDYKKLTSKFV